LVKSANVTVVASKKRTILVIDPPSPASGNVPFSVHISGQLTDAAGYGVGGKTMSVFANGTKIGDLWTNANPLVGWLGIWWMDWKITTAGTYTIHAEFAGDTEWEGCEQTNDIVSAVTEGVPPTPPIEGIALGGLVLFGLLLLGGLALARRKED